MFIHLLVRDIVARTLAQPPRGTAERPARSAAPVVPARADTSAPAEPPEKP